MIESFGHSCLSVIHLSCLSQEKKTLEGSCLSSGALQVRKSNTLQSLITLLASQSSAELHLRFQSTLYTNHYKKSCLPGCISNKREYYLFENLLENIFSVSRKSTAFTALVQVHLSSDLLTAVRFCGSFSDCFYLLTIIRRCIREGSKKSHGTSEYFDRISGEKQKQERVERRKKEKMKERLEDRSTKREWTRKTADKGAERKT